MAPILGILASSQQSAVISTNSYESIASATVSGGSTQTVVFSSIPSTYQHLQLRILGRSGQTADFSSYSVRMTGVNGNIHYMAGNGSSTIVDYNGPIEYPYNLNLPAENQSANIFGVAIVDILDYADTNKYKTLRCFSGWDANGWDASQSGYVRLNSTLFQTTSAVSSLTIGIYQGGVPWVANSTLALYGIKG